MAKYPGRQLTLSIGPTPTLVGQCTSIGEAGSTRGLIDASVYGDDWMDYVSGQQDGSEMDVELALDPSNTGQTALKTAYDDGTPTDFEMEHSDADFHVGFSALVTKFTRGAQRDGLLQASATLKILSPGVEDLSS